MCREGMRLALVLALVCLLAACGQRTDSEKDRSETDPSTRLEDARREVSLTVSADGAYSNEVFRSLPLIPVAELLGSSGAPAVNVPSEEADYVIVEPIRETELQVPEGLFPDYSPLNGIQLFALTAFETPPMYTGSTPMQCVSGRDYSHSLRHGGRSTLIFHAFPDWTTIYSPRLDGARIPLWASTYDNRKFIVAEAAVIAIKDNMFTTREVHFALSTSGRPGTAGPPIFSCLGVYDADTGFKVAEEQLIGERRGRFYPIWPSG